MGIDQTQRVKDQAQCGLLERPMASRGRNKLPKTQCCSMTNQSQEKYADNDSFMNKGKVRYFTRPYVRSKFNWMRYIFKTTWNPRIPGELDAISTDWV